MNKIVINFNNSFPNPIRNILTVKIYIHPQSILHPKPSIHHQYHHRSRCIDSTHTLFLCSSNTNSINSIIY